jgi:hypothetical protein
VAVENHGCVRAENRQNITFPPQDRQRFFPGHPEYEITRLFIFQGNFIDVGGHYPETDSDLPQ